MSQKFYSNSQFDKLLKKKKLKHEGLLRPTLGLKELRNFFNKNKDELK